MSIARDPSSRLIELERILAESRIAVPSGDHEAGSVAAHLAAVPVERLRKMTSSLRAGLNDGLDDVDALTMRLLLNDYALGVAHLRAIAKTAAARMDEAADLIREGQRFVHREQKLDARRSAARAGDEPPQS